MNDKQQQLLGLLRGGKMKVIPARGTPQWNNLADLVMQRSETELKEVFAALTTRDEQQAFVWLVTVVTDFDTAKHIIWKTLASAIVRRELEAQAENIQEMWDKFDRADQQQKAFAKRRDLILKQSARLRKRWLDERRVCEDAFKQINAARRVEDRLTNELDAALARIAELETFVRVAVGTGGITPPTTSNGAS